jgi:hypothetical protein
MTDLKQRLSDKKLELALKKYPQMTITADIYYDKRVGYIAGFDILAPQIVELVEALQKIGNSTHRNAHNNTAVANEALEKFNKFLGE